LAARYEVGRPYYTCYRLRKSSIGSYLLRHEIIARRQGTLRYPNMGKAVVVADNFLHIRFARAHKGKMTWK